MLKGMLADMVVLDADPFAVPPARLEDVRVLLTAVGGRIVFDRQNIVSTGPRSDEHSH